MNFRLRIRAALHLIAPSIYDFSDKKSRSLKKSIGQHTNMDMPGASFFGVEGPRALTGVVLDASFASTEHIIGQVGHVVLMPDKNEKQA